MGWSERRNQPLELSISVEALETGRMDRVELGNWGAIEGWKDPEEVIHPRSPTECHSGEPLGAVLPLSSRDLKPVKCFSW